MNILFNFLAILIVSLLHHSAFAAIPLVEFISKPNPAQSVKPQNTNLIFYTLRNNTKTTFPLTYSFSSSSASLSPLGTTCNGSIAANSTCVVSIQYQAPAVTKKDPVVIQINYQGRAPLMDVVTFDVNKDINCVLLNTASYQTPFCQQQYQNVIQYTPNVFNVTQQNVVDQQTLGGMFGIYQNINNIEQTCYVSCGLSMLSGTAPNENTLFELASVTKTFTTSILGKFIVNHFINSPFDSVLSNLPGAFSLNINEQPVTYQQLATFSGGVCFSDAPSVDQQSTNQIVNQANFVLDINNLNPDPASGNCSDQTPNVKPEYATPPYLPTHNHYSNSSVGLLGQALMHRDGFGVLEADFNNWMCKNITDVLDMPLTSGCLPHEANDGTCGATANQCLNRALWLNANYASGYHIDQNQYQLGDPFLYLPWAPAGGIRSNASDMVKFIKANLGFTTNNTADQTELVQGMLLAHQPNDYLPAPGAVRPNIGSQNPIRGRQGYAWVCMNAPNNGDRICGKAGGHKNFRSFLGLNTTKKYGVIILFNTGSPAADGSLAPTSAIPTAPQIGTNLLENIG